MAISRTQRALLETQGEQIVSGSTVLKLTRYPQVCFAIETQGTRLHIAKSQTRALVGYGWRKLDDATRETRLWRVTVEAGTSGTYLVIFAEGARHE